jgi:ketosteroid isomerase-like protein
MPRDLIEPLLLMATVTLTMSLTSHAGSGPSDAAVRHAIEELHRTYAAAMKRSDVMALASHFAEDAILLPQSSDMQRGRDAIQKWFASWLPTTTFQALRQSQTRESI